MHELDFEIFFLSRLIQMGRSRVSEFRPVFGKRLQNSDRFFQFFKKEFEFMNSWFLASNEKEKSYTNDL